jgi:hypothetical protein
VYDPVTGMVHNWYPWVVIFRYVLYHALGVGVPVSPERAWESVGPLIPVAPPDVNVAVVNEYRAAPDELIAGTIVVGHVAFVKKALGLSNLDEAHTFPWIWRVAAPLWVPIPVWLTKNAVLRIGTLAEVVANIFGAEKAFDAEELPEMCKAAPIPESVRIPTPGPVVWIILAVLIVATFDEVRTVKLETWNEFDA